MKKLVALLLAALLMLSGSAALANVADEVALGEAMTHEELLEKALAEEGSFVVYGNTSRIATALEEFTALYGIAGEANNLKDAEIYIKLETEMSGGAKGADMVMIQDGASLKSQALEINFVPASVKDSVGEEDLKPLVQQYINKVFIWNNLGDNAPAITNVWQLTEPQMKGNVIFKNPESEQVNMNFLVMLTSPEWSDKLAQAYESLY